MQCEFLQFVGLMQGAATSMGRTHALGEERPIADWLGELSRHVATDMRVRATAPKKRAVARPVFQLRRKDDEAGLTVVVDGELSLEAMSHGDALVRATRAMATSGAKSVVIAERGTGELIAWWRRCPLGWEAVPVSARRDICSAGAVAGREQESGGAV